MLVLGVNSAYHESSAVLVRDGQVLFGVEEERLTRVKHAKEARVDNPDQLPLRSIEACLAATGIEQQQIESTVYSLEPGRRSHTVGRDPYPLPFDGWGTLEGEAEFDRRVRSLPVEFVPHHLAHAASAFYSSPFEEAAVLVVDGIGEDSTAWLGRGRGRELERLEEIAYPDSLGMLWERVAVYLGFTAYDAPKVMGLAGYAEPGDLRGLLTVEPEGFRVDALQARLRATDTAGLEGLFGPRPGDPLQGAALAAALQNATEEALLALARRLHRLTGLSRLCYAGGVALNCVANARLEREGPFQEIYIPGASHDAGTALGAALWRSLQAGDPRPEGPLTPFLGPAFTRAPEPALIREAARRLAEGQLVGWFQDRLEFGPRALGHRSLLADPRREEVRADLNRRIKHREDFRPFAAAVLAEALGEWFEIPRDRPGAWPSRELMLLAYPVRPERRRQIPAVVHVDGTCRVQAVEEARDPTFHRLLEEFQALTGVPALLNTSFNDSEPIVCHPDQALETFRRSGLDALVLGDRLVLP